MKELWKFLCDVEEMQCNCLYRKDNDFFYLLSHTLNSAEVLHLNSGELVTNWWEFVPSESKPTLSLLASSLVKQSQVNLNNITYYQDLLTVKLYSLNSMYHVKESLHLDWWSECYDSMCRIFTIHSMQTNNDPVTCVLQMISVIDRLLLCIIPVCKPEVEHEIDFPIYTGFDNTECESLTVYNTPNGIYVEMGEYCLNLNTGEDHMFKLYSNASILNRYTPCTDDGIWYIRKVLKNELKTDSLRSKCIRQFCECVLDFVPEHPMWGLLARYGR